MYYCGVLLLNVLLLRAWVCIDLHSFLTKLFLHHFFSGIVAHVPLGYVLDPDRSLPIILTSGERRGLTRNIPTYGLVRVPLVA